MINNVIDDLSKVFEQLFKTTLLVIIKYVLYVAIEVMKFSIAMFLVFIIAYSLFYFTPGRPVTLFPYLSRVRRFGHLIVDYGFKSKDKDQDEDIDLDYEDMGDMEKEYVRMLRREAQEEYIKLKTKGALEKEFAKMLAKKEESIPIDKSEPSRVPTEEVVNAEDIGDNLKIPKEQPSDETKPPERSFRIGSLIKWWRKKARRISPSRRDDKEGIEVLEEKRHKKLRKEKPKKIVKSEIYPSLLSPITRREDELTDEDKSITSEIVRTRIEPKKEDVDQKYNWNNMEEEWARMVKKKLDDLEKGSASKLEESQEKQETTLPESIQKGNEEHVYERGTPPKVHRKSDNHEKKFQIKKEEIFTPTPIEEQSESSASERSIPQLVDERLAENSENVEEITEERPKSPKIEALEKAFKKVLEVEERKRQDQVKEGVDNIEEVWDNIMKREALEKAFVTILEREQVSELQSAETFRPRRDEYIDTIETSAVNRKYWKKLMEARQQRYSNEDFPKGTPKIRRLLTDPVSYTVPVSQTPRRRNEFESYEIDMSMSGFEPPITSTPKRVRGETSNVERKDNFIPRNRSTPKRPPEVRSTLQRLQRLGEFETNRTDQSISVFAPTVTLTPKRPHEDISLSQNQSNGYVTDLDDIDSSFSKAEKRKIIIPTSKRPRENRSSFSKRKKHVEKFESDEIDESDTDAFESHYTTTPRRRRDDREHIRRRKLLDEFELNENNTDVPVTTSTPKRPRENIEHIRGRKLLDEFELNENNTDVPVTASTPKRPRENKEHLRGRKLNFESNEMDTSISRPEQLDTTVSRSTSTPKIPLEDRKPIRRRKLLDDFDLDEEEENNRKT